MKKGFAFLAKGALSRMIMKTRTRTKTSAPALIADETRRLIEAAAKQPGVADLLKVYGAWQEFDRVFEAQCRFTATKQIVSTSSSSVPMLYETA